MDAGRHVNTFNAAVRSGDWDPFVSLFADDAVLEFVGPQVGPFRGRDAIAEAYRQTPPDDCIHLAGAPVVRGDETVIPYRWESTGSTGTMRLKSDSDGLVDHLTVTFD
ncbi:nuclear transport factor 2 family protein [Nakamurella sp. GG22]